MTARRVTLYHPRTSHEKNYKFFWIPYSLLAIAAEVVRRGYEVRVLDGNAEGWGSLDVEEDVCVGVSAMIGHQVEDGLAFSREVRARTRAPIVWGGAFPTLLPEIALGAREIDHIVRGPADLIFADLVDALAAGGGPVAGVGHRSAQGIQAGTLQALPDREALAPYPLHTLDPARYLRDDPSIADRVINYVSSQGCPFGCGFCTDTAVFRRRWSAYSADRTLAEVCALAERVSARGVKFYDSNFFAQPRRAVEFARGLLGRGADLRWAASAHPRNVLALSDAELGDVRRSGLTRLLVGAETGVQAELDFIGKHLRVAETVEVVRRLDACGIKGSFTFITGYPTMPPEYVDRTVEFATSLATSFPGHEYKIHLYLPFPGTPLFDLAVANGFRPPNDAAGWAEMDYYYIQTPWVGDRYQSMVREFNRTYCPYVS